MEENDLNRRLSQITTLWTMIFQAHQGQADAVVEAQTLLMQRYGGAVYRYLLALLQDPDAADELAQEFAYRFVRGDFRRADPQHGRFRDFVKATVRNLVIDYHRRKKARPQLMPDEDLQSAVVVEDSADPDRQFLESWRSELLTRAWEALARTQQQTGQLFHTVLRLRADHPERRSAQLAEQLTVQLGKPVTDVWVRQMLHRARDKFAAYLIEDVALSLDKPTEEQLHEELLDLGLLEYCRSALKKRSHGP